MELNIDWPNRGHKYEKQDLNELFDFLNDSKRTMSKSYYAKKFEENFSKFIGRKSLSTMSGAHSLDIASFLIESDNEDEIIIPSHTYCASALPFVRTKSKIKWADINPDCFTISFDSVKKLISSRTKAIVIVHLYGLIATDIDKIISLAKERNIIIIEDCAQALGAFKENISVGNFGDISCFSFHSQKNLTTLGEGGMISVKDEKLLDKIELYRHNGHCSFENQSEYWLPAMTNVKYVSQNFIPFKSTLTEAQSIVGINVLKRILDLTKKRRKLFNYLTQKLSSLSELKFQKFETELSHSHHLLPCRCVSDKWNRNDLIKILFEKFKIKCVIQYYPLHRYELFKKFEYGFAEVPNTDEFYDSMISFPFSLTLNKIEIDYLVESIIKSVKSLNDR